MAQITDDFGIATGEKETLSPSAPGLGSNSTIARVQKFLQKVYYYIGMTGEVAVIILMIITAFHVLSRYFLGYPLPGVAEASIFLLTIAMFLLGPYAQSLDGHIKIDLITAKFSKKTRAVIRVVNSIIVGIFMIPFIWQTYVQAQFLAGTHTETSTLRLPVYVLTYLITFSWVLFLIIIVVQIIYVINSLRGGEIS